MLQLSFGLLVRCVVEESKPQGRETVYIYIYKHIFTYIYKSGQWIIYTYIYIRICNVYLCIFMRLFYSSDNHHDNDYHDPSSSWFITMIHHHDSSSHPHHHDMQQIFALLSQSKHGHSAGFPWHSMGCSMAWVPPGPNMVSSATFVLPLPVGA